MKKKVPLSNLEEIIWRMKNADNLADNNILDKKTADPSLLSKLLEIEKDIVNKAIAQGLGHLVKYKNK